MKTAFITSILICMCLWASIAWSDIIHVPGDQPTIQKGIDAAQHGDVVLVTDGTYTGSAPSGNKNLDFQGKIIEVRSENGPEYTIIDCEGDGRGFSFHSGEGTLSVVNGFTITNGYADGRGGGIYCAYSSSPTITNCIIINNSCTSAYGGGIYADMYSSPKIINNVIMGNSARNAGGGIGCNQSSPIISNNIIIGNSADLGGAIWFNYGSPVIANNTIVGNSSGIFCESYSSPIMINTILWQDNPISLKQATIYVTYSDIQGGWPGEGNIDADPLFVDQGNGDYHLQVGSPCIDAGTPTGAPPDDIEGNPRDAFPDMGAYEYVGPSSIEIISPVDGDEYYVGNIIDVIAEVRNGSGNPVEGVEVTFEAIGGIVSPTVVVTDANGQAITQLTVGEGENIVAAIVTDDIFDTVTVIGVVPVGSINGNVIDTVGRPVKLAFVIAVNTDTQEKYKAFTNGNGDYEMPELPAATYWVICIKKGYRVGIKTAEVVAGEATIVDFMLISKLE